MELAGMKVLAFVDEEFEDLEMWYLFSVCVKQVQL